MWNGCAMLAGNMPVGRGWPVCPAPGKEDSRMECFDGFRRLVFYLNQRTTSEPSHVIRDSPAKFCRIFGVRTRGEIDTPLRMQSGRFNTPIACVKGHMGTLPRFRIVLSSEAKTMPMNCSFNGHRFCFTRYPNVEIAAQASRPLYRDAAVALFDLAAVVRGCDLTSGSSAAGSDKMHLANAACGALILES
jgi:hypothetical protein